MKELKDNAPFFLTLLPPSMIRAANKDGSHRDQPRCLLQDRFHCVPQQRPPSLLDTASRQVCLLIQNFPTHVDEIHQVLSVIYPITTNVKVDVKTALVMLPDLFTAVWLMDLLNSLHIGTKRLCVSFATQIGGTHPGSEKAIRALQQPVYCLL
ncbi:hypothetical protein D9C73_020118 [Collichthys lucidus]|uniref:Uncharacterized protein n=1 Tax=Collichthys lucidus TaxID=240159 RepID=A0A4U5VED2_COLLU|nr:hypothetical protein D9C73_020118 [Collichthys lucidus]